MKLIVGIGNPEVKYKNTRHNAGMMVVDTLSSNPKVKGLVIKRSDKFMNDSGSFVKKQINKYPSFDISDLYIVHDDLDIPLGSFKIQFGKGPRDHNGLKDIYDKLGTNEFWHVRVGVDNRNAENRTDGHEYVLDDFNEEEKNVLEKVIKQICNQLVAL
jgi:PTH1 family peptidyl-tRNA hydrolase